MTDTIKINATELKKTFAYIDIEDLLYTMQRDIDFLASHNKNYTKQQYYKIQSLQEIIKQMKGGNETKHVDGADKCVKAWYLSAFPDDEEGREIDDTVTFGELYHAMKMGDSFYKTVGEGIDTVIRERIFEEMSCIFRVPYDDIYKLWLDAAA